MKIYELKQNDDQSVQEGYYMKVTEILRRHSSAILAWLQLSVEDFSTGRIMPFKHMVDLIFNRIASKLKPKVG